MAATGIGFTTVITFDSGFCAQIRSISGPSTSRDVIDTSHMGTTEVGSTGTGWRTKMGGLIDAGELTIDLVFDATEVAAFTAAAAECVITWTDGAIWTFDAFVSGYEPTASYDDLMTASVTLAISGPVVIT